MAIQKYNSSSKLWKLFSEIINSLGSTTTKFKYFKDFIPEKLSNNHPKFHPIVCFNKARETFDELGNKKPRQLWNEIMKYVDQSNNFFFQWTE